MWLPENRVKLTMRAVDVIAECRVSAAKRVSQAQDLMQWFLMGSNDGNMAIYNKLVSHIPRVSSYLYQPDNMQFHADCENYYTKEILQQVDMGARVLTREWERRDIDVLYGHGVTEALLYGACIPKALWHNGGLASRLVMPWCFGVYREDQNDIRKQEAVCESTYITTHELWRRIQHMPDAKELYKRAVAHAKKNSAGDYNESYFHNVIISGNAPVVQSQPPFSTQPGGFVDIATDYAVASLSPTVNAGLVAFHELWVWDDGRGDFTTIQLVEPDILICPLYKRSNLFVEGSQSIPYGLIQPNRMEGYFWGRSELLPLMKLQAMLRDGMTDIKKLLSVQFDRILAFKNFGMNDERYDQLRRAGWIANEEQGGEVQDLTPQMPSDAFKYIDDVIRFMDEGSGFQAILTGQGEQGVRAGSHASVLSRNASPHLRNRALITSRQVGDFGDTCFKLMKAKDDQAYWTTPEEGESEASEFLLSQLPDDARIGADPHLTSPVFQQDAFGQSVLLAKAGVMDGEDVLANSSVANKDTVAQKYRDRKRAQQKLMEEKPWLFAQQQGKAGGKRPAQGA